MYSILYLLGLLWETFGRCHLIRVWGAEGAVFEFLTLETDVVLILMISLGTQCVDLESLQIPSQTRGGQWQTGGGSVPAERGAGENASLLLY